MRLLRIPSLSGIFVLCCILLAACGNSGITGAQSTPTNNGTGSYTAPAAATPTPTIVPSSTSGIKTAMATIQGKTETILTNAQGFTLYYFTPDTATTTACTGDCATNWPPLIVSDSSSTLTSDTSVSGKLTVVADQNGTQVQYNSHFLYTFVGDTASGQTNGEGKGGKWFVATVDLS
jgi:predicted lipoprotein with Yx(FWY)xxD motif